MLKLSIITINLNNADGLRKTMESVFSQTYCDFEYIVIDGVSTDGSMDIIRDYELNNSTSVFAFKWQSELDHGIYEAMNKGVRMAKGEYTLMLNSGDYLLTPSVIEHIIPLLDGTDIIQCNNIEVRSGMYYRNRGYGRSELSIYDIMEGVFLHQASFCKRKLFEQYGYFDESYTLVADTKFFITCLGVNNASFKYIDIDVVNYDKNGISAARSGPWYQKHMEEYVRLRNEMFPYRYRVYFQKNEPKVRLYDKLHRHLWIWNVIRLLVRVCNWIYGAENKGERIERIQ